MVARDLEVDKRFPDLINVWDEIEMLDLDDSHVMAASGIHNPNTSILPFALKATSSQPSKENSTKNASEVSGQGISHRV